VTVRPDAPTRSSRAEIARFVCDHGDVDDAVAHYREALRIDPHSAAARDMLQLALDRQRG
jgi:cytochrome c-type biogenesis protein CcmH/NrfG